MVVLIEGTPVDPVLRQWGRNIKTTRNLRNARGDIRRKGQDPMSQADLAELVGVTQGTVSRWEEGKLEPRRDRKARIAEALSVDIETLFPLAVAA